MTDRRISRRALLGVLGGSAVGATAAGATNGMFADMEQVGSFFRSGAFDLKVGWQGDISVEPNPPESPRLDQVGDPCENLPDADALPDPLFTVEDVTPGDDGEATFGLHLCDNDGYIWMTGGLRENAENELLDTEAGDETPDEGELADRLRARAWYDLDCDNTFEDSDVEIVSGSLREVLSVLETGYQLHPDPGVDRCRELERVDDQEEGGKIEETELSGSVGDTYEFTYGEETVLVQLTDVEYKEEPESETSMQDAEVVAVELTVMEPEDVGLCRVDVKAGPGDPETYTFDDCAGTVRVESTQQRPGRNETGDVYAISHLRLFGCDDSGGCFEASNTHCIGFEWWLPDDAPTDAQTDSTVFDLGFEAVQCRHNPDAQRL